MPWNDIFYPGNPERRENLIRKNQELRILMKNNFRATNKLIESLKEHLGWSFNPITLNEKDTIKENCDIIIERIREIQKKVEKIDTQLKEKLEPTLYEKLKNMNLSANDFTKVSRNISVTLGILGGASALVVFLVGTCGGILTNMTSICAKLGAGIAGGIACGLVFVGIDMIVGAILGSIERSSLEKSLKEYDEALEVFGPASEEYQDRITEVRLRLQMSEKR